MSGRRPRSRGWPGCAGGRSSCSRSSLTAGGVAVDVVRAGALGVVFLAAYPGGCVLATLLAQRRDLFVPMVQPPLLLAVSVPVAVAATGSLPASGGLVSSALAVGAPLINGFPAMAITTVVCVVIGLIRMRVQRWQRAGDDAARREPVRSAPAGGASRDRGGPAVLVAHPRAVGREARERRESERAEREQAERDRRRAQERARAERDREKAERDRVDRERRERELTERERARREPARAQGRGAPPGGAARSGPARPRSRTATNRARRPSAARRPPASPTATSRARRPSAARVAPSRSPNDRPPNDRLPNDRPPNDRPPNDRHRHPLPDAAAGPAP